MTKKYTFKESVYLFQYRILVYLLFKNLDYIKYDSMTKHVEIRKMSKFSVEVGYLTARIRDGLRELERLNIISDLKFSYNKAAFYLAPVHLVAPKKGAKDE